MRLESDSFLERYAVSTNADQDQLAVWQLFSPALIDWLTTAAPAGFSFELQDGALSRAKTRAATAAGALRPRGARRRGAR